MDARKRGVTSDDMSFAMLPFLAEVETVKKLPGGLPFAFDLAMDLARFSYGCLDGGGCGYGNRLSDKKVDGLIRELARERRDEEPGWDFGKAFEILRSQSKELAEYGIEGFCAGSIGLMEGWMGEEEDFNL